MYIQNTHLQNNEQRNKNIIKNFFFFGNHEESKYMSTGAIKSNLISCFSTIKEYILYKFLLRETKDRCGEGDKKKIQKMVIARFFLVVGFFGGERRLNRSDHEFYIVFSLSLEEKLSYCFPTTWSKKKIVFWLLKPKIYLHQLILSVVKIYQKKVWAT